MGILKQDPKNDPTELDLESDGQALDQLNKDGIFHILSNSRRRHVLRYLSEQDGNATKRDVSRYIAAQENDVPMEDVTPAMRKPVYIALHQTHIPQMEDEGVIQVNGQGNTLTLSETSDELRRYMGMDRREDAPWRVFYLGLSAVSCTLVALSVLGVNFVPPIVLTGAVAGAFTAASLFYAEAWRWW